MKPERWARIEHLYHVALEREPEERAAFLDEVCAGDETLRRQVGALLSCDDRAEDFIESPALQVAAQALVVSDPTESPACAEPTVTSQTGSQIGAYQILALIGRGGMGEVHLALDPRLGRKVALKLLPSEFTANAERVRRFAQEARAASALNHPNIITIHEIGEVATETGSSRYIVTEYVEGETLRQQMANSSQRRMKPSEVIDVASQIAAALSAAHEAGIIHRDIKPENVMVRRDRLVKVLDFGLAKLTEEGQGDKETRGQRENPHTFTGMVMGTPRYMSPEQARGKEVDARTDIFSLGVTIYEMLAGRAPFAGETPTDVIVALLEREPAPIARLAPDAPADLHHIVNKALRKDREERYESVKSLLADLKALKEEMEFAAKLERSSPSESRAASPEMEGNDELDLAHVLFCDIVGYSLLPIDEQTRMMRRLQEIVRQTEDYRRAEASDQLVRLPAGDGMALAFLHVPAAPVRCALEIARSLKAHPEIRLRMGVHSGPVFRSADINANRNVVGSGINLAQRVMDCGDAGHILVSSNVAEVLGQVSRWQPFLHDLGEVEVKHGVKLHLFNLYTDEVGNAETPSKLKGEKAASARKEVVSVASINMGVVNRHKLGAALALVVVIVATCSAYLFFNRSKPALTEKDTILLVDFENKTGDDVFDETLKQGLATQLQQSPFLQVFPEARVRQTLRQMERASDTRITTELAPEICERQNLKAFITGSIAPLGSHYVITLAALHGRSGEELTRTQAEASGKEQVLHALAQATAQLRAQLGESLSSIQQFDKPLEQATTANLQALKAFSACWELSISGRVIEALPFARRAAELDPQFTLAYDQLAVICWATEQPEAAAEYQAKIVRLQEERAAQSKYPVSEDYKLDIDTWYQRLVTGNLNKSLEILLVRRKMWPNSPHVQTDLGLGYILIGQSEQALTPLNEVIRLNRNFAPSYKLLAQALNRLNRFAEAKDALTKALQLKLGLTEYHTQLYQLAFISADAAGMREQLAWSQGEPDEYVALDWQTGSSIFAGQWRQAQEFSRRAIELAAQRDNREVAARYATEQALRSAVLGDCRLARSNAEQGLSIGHGRIPLSRASLAFALCGETGQPKSLANELAKRFPEDTLMNSLWLPMIRAAILLQSGVSIDGAAQAIKQLEITSRYEGAAEFWPQYLRGQAYLKLSRGMEAAVEFQKILDHRGYAPLSALYPLAHLGLARAAALTGDTAISRKAYEEFFAVWKGADPDLPPMIEAKREYDKK